MYIELPSTFISFLHHADFASSFQQYGVQLSRWCVWKERQPPHRQTPPQPGPTRVKQYYWTARYSEKRDGRLPPAVNLTPVHPWHHPVVSGHANGLYKNQSTVEGVYKKKCNRRLFPQTAMSSVSFIFRFILGTLCTLSFIRFG